MRCGQRRARIVSAAAGIAGNNNHASMTIPIQRMRSLRWGLDLIEAMQRDQTVPLALREQAGQLGSHFTAPLARRQPFTDPERIAINRSRGRIDSLHDWVDQAAAVATSVAVVNALDTMHHRYFGRGSELVDEIVLRNGDLIELAGTQMQFIQG